MKNLIAAILTAVFTISVAAQETKTRRGALTVETEMDRTYILFMDPNTRVGLIAFYRQEGIAAFIKRLRSKPKGRVLIIDGKGARRSVSQRTARKLAEHLENLVIKTDTQQL